MTSIRYQVGIDGLDWQQLHDILIEDEFHNGRSVAQYQASFENTHTVVLAYDGDKLVGTVRALSDGVCNAYIVDVWTYTPHRRRGIAREMMRLTFEQLRGQHVFLWTDDQQAFYESIGMHKDIESDGFALTVGEWLNNNPSNE